MRVLFKNAPAEIGEMTGRGFDDNERLIELRVGDDVYPFVATGQRTECDGYIFEVYEYERLELLGLRRWWPQSREPRNHGHHADTKNSRGTIIA